MKRKALSTRYAECITINCINFFLYFSAINDHRWASQLAIVNLLSKMKCLFSSQVVFVPGQVVTRPPKVLTGDHIHAI